MSGFTAFPDRQTGKEADTRAGARADERTGRGEAGGEIRHVSTQGERNGKASCSAQVRLLHRCPPSSIHTFHAP